MSEIPSVAIQAPEQTEQGRIPASEKTPEDVQNQIDRIAGGLLSLANSGKIGEIHSMGGIKAEVDSVAVQENSRSEKSDYKLRESSIDQDEDGKTTLVRKAYVKDGGEYVDAMPGYGSDGIRLKTQEEGDVSVTAKVEPFGSRDVSMKVGTVHSGGEGRGNYPSGGRLPDENEVASFYASDESDKDLVVSSSADVLNHVRGNLSDRKAREKTKQEYRRQVVASALKK